jgi:hypothetical protein
MTSSSRSRRKPKLEPISLAELADTPGMSGFCTFLTRTSDQAVPVLDQPLSTQSETPPVSNAPAKIREMGGGRETPPVSSAPPLTDTVLLSPPELEFSPEREAGGVSNTPPVAQTPVGVLGATSLEVAGRSNTGGVFQTASVIKASLVTEASPVSNADDVLKTPPILDAPLVGNTSPLIRTRSPQIARRFQPLDNARVRKAARAQDGHTMAEQLIYSALYSSEEGSPLYRDVAVGNRWIMAQTGLSERTVQLNLKSLQLKLSLEILRRHDPDTNEPTLYRVHSMDAILERRRAAGLDLVAKKRGGGVRLASSGDAGGV